MSRFSTQHPVEPSSYIQDLAAAAERRGFDRVAIHSECDFHGNRQFWVVYAENTRTGSIYCHWVPEPLHAPDTDRMPP